MNCPVCDHQNLDPKAEACPTCKTPLSSIKIVQQLQSENRSKRNVAMAWSILVIVITLLSASYIYYVHNMNYGPSANQPELTVVKTDSLRNLGYTIEEQNRDIEEMGAELESLKVQLEELMNDSTGMDFDEAYNGESNMQAEQAPKKVAVQKSTKTPASISGDVHIVQAGETLWGIAQQHFGNGNRCDELAASNGIENIDYIVVGETLALK